MISLTVIIPTIGRDSLPATLASLADLTETDQLILAADGLVPEAFAYLHEALPKLRCKTLFLALVPPDGCFGNVPRQTAMKLATSDYLLFQDDDDAYLPGGLNKIREVCTKHKGSMVFFGMRRGDTVIPNFSMLKLGNVSSQNGAVPNEPKNWGTWTRRYPGDYDFFKSCRFPLLWRQDIVVAVWRPALSAKKDGASPG